MKINRIGWGMALFPMLMGAPAVAQQKEGAPPALVINGTPIAAAVKTYSGKTFVDIEKLAKALDLTITQSPGVIVIEGAAQSKSASTLASISGNLLYYFNRNYGSRPDTGAKVYLLDAGKELNINDNDAVLAMGESIIVVNSLKERSVYPVLQHTIADGNGRYELKSVPPGKYVLIAISSHAKGMTLAEIQGRILKRPVEVHPGATLDVSHDFGITYY